MPYTIRDLNKACQFFDLERVTDILDQNPELINVREQVRDFAGMIPGKTPLMTLLNCNYKFTSPGLLPVHKARVKATLDLLIARGADVDDGSREGECRPLDAALDTKDISFIQALVDAGANTDYIIRDTLWGDITIQELVPHIFAEAMCGQIIGILNHDMQIDLVPDVDLEVLG